jgi:hypothetical protein
VAPKRSVHPSSGPPGSPEGAMTLDRMEAVHQHLLHNGWAVCASLDESLRPPAQPCGRPRRKRRCQLEQRLASLFIGIHAAAVSPPPHHSSLGKPVYRDAREPLPQNSSESSTFAQHPIGWMHQHRRRLPVFGAGSSARATAATFGSKSRMPGYAGFGRDSTATLPSRSRSTPTLPNRRSKYLGTRNMPQKI